MPVTCAIALGAALACADGDAAEEIQERIRALREEVACLQTLRRAGPTIPQAEWMLQAARFLARERDAAEARRAAILVEQREAFRRFLEEDERDRGFTPEVERAAGVAAARLKDLQEEYERRLARITAAVREVLSPAQRDAAEGRTAAPRGLDPNRPPWTVEEVMSLLLRARALPEAEFRRREGQIAAFALRSPGVRPGATRDEVVAALRRFRAGPEEDLPRLRDEVVREVFPGVRAADLARQVAVLKRTEDEPPGLLGKFLESRSAVPALESLLARLRSGRPGPGPGGGSPSDPPPPPKDDRKGRDRARPAEEKEKP